MLRRRVVTGGGRLRSIPNPPPVLWIRGHLPKLTAAVAIVGTRTPSAFGVRVAESAAEAAVSTQLMVVSGLAPGCDTAAHQRTLDLGGQTVAFLGGALMEPQPASNRALAEKILDLGGALVTEIAPARPETKSARVSRDRLQSGYSAGTDYSCPDLFDLRVTRTRTIVESLPECILLRPIHADNHGPRTMVMRRRRAMRQPRDREHSQRMVGLLVQEMYAKSLFWITGVIALVEPILGDGHPLSQRNYASYDLFMFFCICSDASKVGNKLRQGIRGSCHHCPPLTRLGDLARVKRGTAETRIGAP